MLDPEVFIRSQTSELWAEIYQKRARAFNVFDWYDAAAQINQRLRFSIYNQDDVIKELFREIVDYISKVSWDAFISRKKLLI